MRVVVDIFRVGVFVCLAALLIGAGFLAILLGFGGYVLDSPLTWPALAGFALAALAAVGIIATLIEIHDRLGEMAAQTKRIADSLEDPPMLLDDVVT